MHESTRDPRDDITGSAPLDNALEVPPRATFAPLTFDPQEFMAFVAAAGLSEQEALLCLRAHWEIVVAFVDLRYGLGPMREIVDRSSNVVTSQPAESPSVVSSSSISSKHKQVAASRKRVKVTEEDS